MCETVISVEGVSKKYCRTLRHTMLYGISDLSKSFLSLNHHPPVLREGEFYAVNDISFEVKRGEILGIIGVNGSGKSTLLKMLNGIFMPDRGQIEIEGRVGALIEVGAGFHPMLTGRENIYVNGAIYGMSRKEIKSKFDSIVEFAEIEEFLDSPVKHYSSGMYVRLGFAVAAHCNPDILLVDEALSVGDSFFQQKCMRFLRKFMETGTVVFVSHDIAAVVNLCHKVLLMNKGEIVEFGSPKCVTEKYLEKLYEFRQGESFNKCTDVEVKRSHNQRNVRDMRQDFINHSTLRNDIELFSYKSESECFGSGGVSISDVSLLDGNGTPLGWVVGGEDVCLSIQCIVHEPIYRPIVGFLVKDRLGQVIFGDNTYLIYADFPLKLSPENSFEVCFNFTQPIMPIGDYTISVAVADGSQEDHVQLVWLHEAIAFRVHSSSVCHGLIGVPMSNIQMRLL